MTDLHAILLCAGLGSRMLPLTADRPKCLIEVGGKTILEHQLDALRHAGVSRVTVVGGYQIDAIERLLDERMPIADRPELAFNPFFAGASSIASVWLMRACLDRDFCILNGDTVYGEALVADAIARLERGINLVVEPIDAAQPDDMLVRMADGLVEAVGKRLIFPAATHRSLGIVASVDGGSAYRDALDAVIREPDGVHRFHHDVIDRLARSQPVSGIVADGRWVEIDRPEDIDSWGHGPGAATLERQAKFAG